MINLNNIIIRKEIGRGFVGTIYLALYRVNDRLAYKIEHIFERDIIKSFKSPLFREIDFAKVMYSLHPNHFMKLYDWKIDNKSKNNLLLNTNKNKMDDLPKIQQSNYMHLWDSKYCAIKLYSYVDTTLHNIMWQSRVFDYKLFYDLFIQVIYVVYLMKKQGYNHNDFHPKNIGLKKTDKQFITLIGFTEKAVQIRTHGYYVVAIDYGSVLHEKYDLNERQIEKLNNYNDIFTLMNFLSVNYSPLFAKYKKELEHANIMNSDIDIPKNIEDNLNKYLKDLNLPTENRTYLLKLLFKVLHYDKYEKYLLGDKLKHPIKPMYLLPINAILYIISNIYDIKKILIFLINNKS